MSSINSVAISGRTTRDIELRHTPSGLQIAEFGVAVSKSKKQDDGSYEEETSFVDVTFFGNFAELLARKITKGARVSIQGELKQDTWENDAGEKRSKVKIIGRQLDSSALFEKVDAAPATEAADVTKPTDDDIPF